MRPGFICSPVRSTGTAVQAFAGARHQAQSPVDALGADIPADRDHALRQGIMAVRMVALASTDKMEAWFWKKQQKESEYNQVRERRQEAQRNWLAFGAGGYAAMNGAEMLADL